MNKNFYIIILFFSIYSLNINAQWFAQESGTTDLLYAIKFVDNNNGWVTNLNGTKLFHTTNGGTDWFVQKDFGTPVIWNFTFINDSIGYIYSHGGPAHLLKTTDGGTTWQTIHTFSATVDDLKFYSENTGWCLEFELTSYLSRTTNGGVDWQGFDYFNSFDGFLGRVGLIDENTVIVPGEYFTGEYIIFKTTDGGTTWTEIPVNYELLGGRIQFVTPNIGWIEDSGNLYKTTDGGYNWEFQVSTHYDFFFINENVGWYLDNNQINKTTDGGLTWITQNSGTNNTLYTINFLDQNNGWVSGDSGTIIYSPNGGTPVELTLFKAEASGNNIFLNWETATETNNRGFEIQRSKVGSLKTEWQKVGFVNGSGTTTEQHSYSFKDENLQSGKYSYRLKQVDFDGTYKYSDIVEAEVAPSAFSLSQNYPNPFNPATSFQYTVGKRQIVTLKVYDVLGKKVATLVNEEKSAGNYRVKFDGSNLASGIYFYQLNAGSYTATKKLILLK